MAGNFTPGRKKQTIKAKPYRYECLSFFSADLCDTCTYVLECGNLNLYCDVQLFLSYFLLLYF